MTHVVRWQRGLALQNPRTAMDRSALDVVYLEHLDGGGERTHDGRDTVLSYARTGGAWRRIRGRLRVRNRTGQPLFVVLAYFSDDYGVYILPTDGIATADAWVTVWGDGPTDDFYLADGVDQSLERFKLVVSTEKIDDFLLAQPALTLGERTAETGPSAHSSAAAGGVHQRVVHARRAASAWCGSPPRAHGSIDGQR